MIAIKDIVNVSGIVIPKNKVIFKMTFKSLEPFRRNTAFAYLLLEIYELDSRNL